MISLITCFTHVGAQADSRCMCSSRHGNFPEMSVAQKIKIDENLKMLKIYQNADFSNFPLFTMYPRLFQSIGNIFFAFCWAPNLATERSRTLCYSALFTQRKVAERCNFFLKFLKNSDFLKKSEFFNLL